VPKIYNFSISEILLIKTIDWVLKSKEGHMNREEEEGFSEELKGVLFNI